MEKYDNLVEEVKNNTVLSPFSDLIDSILEYDGEGEDNLEAQLPIILDIVTARIQSEKERLISDMISGFENTHLTKKDVNEGVKLLTQEASNFIEKIKESDKKNVLHAILNEISNVYNEAAEKYHSYNFILPISLEEGAQMPTYAHDSDACADVYAFEDQVIPAHSLSNKIRTGLHFVIPEGWEIGLLPRSSIGLKTGLRLSNSRAVIDQQFRDEMIIIYDNISDSDYIIKAGDRIAQMFVQPTYRFKATQISKTDFDAIEGNRGGGMGSTGK